MRGTKSDLREYLKAAFQANRSWDQMFREMLLGQSDDPEQNGAITFVKARIKDPDQLANDVSVLFFGVNVSCAKCHDHPLVADWTQDHYFGMKSFFSRTLEAGEFIGENGLPGSSNIKTDRRRIANRPSSCSSPATSWTNRNRAGSREDEKAEKQRKEKDKDRKEPPPPPSFSRRAQLVEVGPSARRTTGSSPERS